MILFIDACVREKSRTRVLAEALLGKLSDEVTRVRLEEVPFDLTDQRYLEKRDALIAKGAFDDDMFSLARQFAQADTIVIAAPYWDLSFPSLLKIYFENVYAMGIVSRYGPDGVPVGLCRAKKLYYVTTAGGPYVSDFSFGYVKALATCFGIPEAILVKAEMLDVVGFDPDKIVADTIALLDGLVV